ncbi:hypothetical protein BO85DRAFT_53259 [Aspergillus piperis CBS 112811]|uniref:Uncharacterized protein n=1 Tax=Aspergillus piperis CBS 112811 TaxID=1448313 RepID=A0A8G1R0T2_9EURO|nr:hypothetical protein BO85DRAFT_53259 [Aspergillus piperis CBS 112811]RAH56551.1 hypothetical protein BO85DRAFT_53259 [Aspergillus piperis CBS 112811]
MCVDDVADQVEISARVFLLLICILFEGYSCSICHDHSAKVQLGCLGIERSIVYASNQMHNFYDSAYMVM